MSSISMIDIVCCAPLKVEVPFLQENVQFTPGGVPVRSPGTHAGGYRIVFLGYRHAYTRRIRRGG